MTQKLRAYAELLRVSNVLTAVADVWMGMVVATGTLAPASLSVPLTAISVLLYLSGMVLNDVFDVQQDAAERPTRPIPSGRISRTEAAMFGGMLILVAMAIAAWLSHQRGSAFPLAIASMLAVGILAYDFWLKSSPIAPIIMGLCRSLNASLGLTAMSYLSPLKTQDYPPAEALPILLGVTVYIAGVTIFARQEAAVSGRQRLALGALVSLGGIGLFASLPWLSSSPRPLEISAFRWLVMWSIVAMLVGRRYAAALLQPRPHHVQAAVGNAIQSVIIINAALAWGYADPFWALAIFALLPPTMLMARLIPPT